MSINEAPIAGSNLTPEQRRQQEAQILGVRVEEAAPAALTPDQIEWMRLTVMRHDAAHQPTEFDLNKPPKKPYQYQDYPKMLYLHSERRTQVVSNIQQENGLIALGYVREPFEAEAAPPAPVLDPATLAEIAKIDAALKAKKPATR